MRRTLPAVVAALCLLAGCGGTSTPAQPESDRDKASATPSAAVGRYVAIGDSYTAAPYVYLTDVAEGCLRSDGNYPALLGKRLDASTVDDVSCSGATTADVTGRQATFRGQSVPAQIDAVTADTDLVTVGLGGNDYGLFGNLVSGCPVVGPPGTPAFSTGTAGTCGSVDRAAAARDLDGVERRLTETLQRVRDRAPDATVVLVGYPRIASADRSCPKLLPMTRANATAVDDVTRQLSRVMARAASAADADYVDMYAASKGHDVCAGSAAWVNGVRTDTARAASLHPFAEEQAAVARLVAGVVRRAGE